MANQPEDFIKQFINQLPPGLRQFKQDLEHHAKTVLTEAARKSDLVTREEFEAQKKVLQKTRGILDQLEKKIAELEKKKI